MPPPIKREVKEMIKWEDLLYKTSELEKALLRFEPVLIPEKGFTGIWESTFELEHGFKAIVAYLEGGNRLGCRYTFVIVDNKIGHVLYGWAKGWRLPVPERGELKEFQQGSELTKAMARAKKEVLSFVDSLPRFYRENGKTFCKGGWYTTSLFALPRPTPSCLGEARVWSIKEGIYVYFPDGSYRLIPHRKWGEWLSIIEGYSLKLIGRQGDLLVFTSPCLPQLDDDWNVLDEVYFDNHVVTCKNKENSKIRYFSLMCGGYVFQPLDDNEFLVFTHPEHEKVEIEVPDDGCLVMLLPGTSRPFQNKID